MDLTQLAGNAALKRQLELQTARRGLSHAYIISGPPGSGRHTLAGILAAALVCTGTGEIRPCGRCPACRKAQGGIHPDIVTVGEANKDITVAQVREMRADAWVRPNEAPCKVYLLPNAQNMNASAQNAMLKLLEEGPSYAAFLLIADNAAALLPTVRSRCQLLSLTEETPPEEDPALAETAQALLDCLARGDELGLLQRCVPLEKWERTQFLALLDTLTALLRDGLTGRLNLGLTPRRMLSAVDQVERLRAACGFNVGVGHLAGWLCAGLF